MEEENKILTQFPYLPPEFGHGLIHAHFEHPLHPLHQSRLGGSGGMLSRSDISAAVAVSTLSRI